MDLRPSLLGLPLALSLIGPVAAAPDPAPPDAGRPDAALPEATLPELVVQAQRAAAARQEILTRFGAREELVVEARRGAGAGQEILPRFGGGEGTIDRRTIEGLPGGGNQPLNALLAQTPGVVQDSFGEIHIRGEHRNLQYRLNGVVLP